MPVPVKYSAASDGALSKRTFQKGERLKFCERCWEKAYRKVPGPEPRTGREVKTPFMTGMAVE